MKTACVDIGGTYIKTAVLEDGRLSSLQETPTNAAAGAEQMLRNVAELVHGMPGVQCVGISTAGEVEPQTGRLPVCLQHSRLYRYEPENSAGAAAGPAGGGGKRCERRCQGEYAFRSGKGETGFCDAYLRYRHRRRGLCGRAAVPGQPGSAGEFGGLITHPEAVDPACQGTGSYERYASTTALVKRVSARFPELTDGRAIFARLEDEGVRAEVDGWIREISYGLVSLIHAFDPEAVVLGGGVMKQDYIQSQLARQLQPLLKPSFRAAG